MLLPLLPPECSALIKENGLPLEKWNPGSEEVAFTREISLKILDTLNDRKIVVVGGHVVRVMQGRLKYVYATWGCDKKDGESSSMYAQRSLDTARDYIRNFQPIEKYEPLFVVTMTAWI